MDVSDCGSQVEDIQISSQQKLRSWKFVFYKRLSSAGTEALIAICSPPSIIYRKEIFIGKRLCAHHWNPHDIFQVTWICLNVWFTLGKLRKTSSGGHANLL